MTTEIDVVIEIPRGSRNKYEFDHEAHVFRLDRRIIPDEIPGAAERFITALIKESARKMPGIKVDVRRILHAMELIRVLYAQLHGIDVVAPSDQQTSVPIAGLSYWVRQALESAAKAKKRDDDELSKHYRELLGILQLTKRTIRDGRFYRYRYSKQMELMHRIRQLPDVYSSFYWLADSLSYRL